MSDEKRYDCEGISAKAPAQFAAPALDILGEQKCELFYIYILIILIFI